MSKSSLLLKLFVVVVYLVSLISSRSIRRRLQEHHEENGAVVGITHPESQLSSRSLAAADMQSLPNEWSDVIPTPLIAVAAVALSNGKVLYWAAFARFTTPPPGGIQLLGATQTAIYDPATNTNTRELVVNTKHDMFCPGTSTMPDGRIMITGGSVASAVTFYNPDTNQWSRGAELNIGRGYHTQIMLPDGSVLTVGGSWSGRIGGKVGELWTPSSGRWVLKPGINPESPASSSMLTNDSRGIYRSDNHMWFVISPDGHIFHAGPSMQMHWIDVTGDGSVETSGLARDEDSMNGNIAVFDVGQVLIYGGAPSYNGTEATNKTYLVDLRDGKGNETIREVGNMHYPRCFHSSVVLPTGHVVVTGGQEESYTFTDWRAVYYAEIWDPETEVWTVLPEPMVTPRTYHSVAVLMKDGRVWVAGGGNCGFCNTNHPDIEMLTPPYLLNPDGTAIDPNSRPLIIASPGTVAFGVQEIAVTMAEEDDDYTFAAMRIGAFTHATNLENVRVPLEIVRNDGDEYILDVPPREILLPGTYYLFAMKDGVPSIAEAIKVEEGSISDTAPIQAIIRSQLHSNQCVQPWMGFFFRRVVQWPCNTDNLNQQFVFEPVEGFYRVRVASNGFCIQVRNGSTDRGATVIPGDCNDEPHQLWSVAGEIPNQQLMVRHTGYCLNVYAQSLIPGTRLVQGPCWGDEQNNDKWAIDNRLSL